MKVYRVQDKLGRGPWKPGFTRLWAEDRTDEDYEYLAPFPLKVMLSLPKSSPDSHVGYGCTSLDKLKRWFTSGEYYTLMRYGYNAVAMEADEILIESESQCAFSRKKPFRNQISHVQLYGPTDILDKTP